MKNDLHGMAVFWETGKIISDLAKKLNLSYDISLSVRILFQVIGPAEDFFLVLMGNGKRVIFGAGKGERAFF